MLVGWGYTHPSGGVNGLEIGAAAYDEAAGRWAWRCASPRTTGHVAD